MKRKRVTRTVRPKAAKSAKAAAAAPDAKRTRELLQSKRFLAADRASVALAEIATWDDQLVREHRMLVPIDVQALYVPPGDTERMVRLPMLVAGPGGKAAERAEDGLPAPFTEGTPRPAGVHLHWAMPDALLRGRLQQADTDGGGGHRLGLPPLPDRWVVMRLALPVGGREPVISGWVLEADRAIAVPLPKWTEGTASQQGATAAGLRLDRAQLTGTVGGAVSWSGVYDAVLNRFAFHDTLADLAAAAPGGVDGNCASYVVAGWWSDPASDPLDGARSKGSLHEILDRLRWRLLAEWGDESRTQKQELAEAELRKALGLETGDRWGTPRKSAGSKPADGMRAPASTAPFMPVDRSFLADDPHISASVFAAEAHQRYVAPAWHLRSSLLHGAIYGVPVAGAPPIDRRPAAAGVSLALGFHDDDVLAAHASAATPSSSTDERRTTERMLTAFTAQKVTRLGSPDGAVELEEHEHAATFASLAAGSAGTDRYLQRVQTGGVGGLGLGHHSGATTTGKAKAKSPRASAPAPQKTKSNLVFSVDGRPTLTKASASDIHDIARSRVGDVLAPTEARVVDRPQPRFTFPCEPMVAVRGASRSLRHGGDGRGSADGMLSCRWPTHVISEISGLVAKDRFVPSLGNGSVPTEVLSLLREAMILDPYHHGWMSSALAPPGPGRVALSRRLQAESVLRFGVDGTYDGATAVFAAVAADPADRGPAAAARLRPGQRTQQTMVAAELRKHSLYRGAEPDLVGVTAWAQPWVPMWLEWELTIEGLDPPTLAAWTLGSIDLDSGATTFAGEKATLRGRALLTAGAAHTLHDAISDWLRNEDALDDDTAGLMDEETEEVYRRLAEAVERLDVTTATLDGLRAQLLGLPVRDGVIRPSSPGAGTVGAPVPVARPFALLAGAVKLTRARLVDAFGRTLEIPTATVAVPTRASLPARPNELLVRPRLLRPARWQFRLVDAGTAVGNEGAEARVDQIEPALQVNPVAGFLMPDHLDESLEIFGVDGQPIGELLHEAVSGGVMWEIAAGREGPADAGPHHGLTPAQKALGDFAAALVGADAAARAGAAQDPTAGKESALSALLRAIDTTLWTVDSFAALGSEHVAGLVGRPVAVVRAQLRLELRPPVDVDLSDPARAAEWAEVERSASRYAFPVRIGELTRSDDGVLGFFVDDDYRRFRLVDKAIAATAPDAGRSRGQLGLHGQPGGDPVASGIDHPYIAGTDDADTLQMHIGQTVTLTILMHPAGKASLTSGLLPRKALALARDWVGPGLAALAPSLRTGPVLVETDLAEKGQVRLPKISVFGQDQNFLWRDTPATWRTDAILAATQTALLPDHPAEVREGWIRVAPTPEKAGTP